MALYLTILIMALQGVRGGVQTAPANPAATQGARGQGARGQGARGAGPATQNANSVSSVEFVIDPPTLINLGFEWFIQGDENRNASVAVSYRKKGETAWKPALPMLRLKGERVYQQAQVDVISPNMFAGSIMDLDPDTDYEAQFVMTDPDGVRGESRRVVTVRTRPEPVPYEGGRVFHVYPHGYSGQKIEPSFEGLMCAYNYSCAGTDWATRAGLAYVRATPFSSMGASTSTTGTNTPTLRLSTELNL
jgi:hypothetical protein